MTTGARAGPPPQRHISTLSLICPRPEAEGVWGQSSISAQIKTSSYKEEARHSGKACPGSVQSGGRNPEPLIFSSLPTVHSSRSDAGAGGILVRKLFPSSVLCPPSTVHSSPSDVITCMYDLEIVWLRGFGIVQEGFAGGIRPENTDRASALRRVT